LKLWFTLEVSEPEQCFGPQEVHPIDGPSVLDERASLKDRVCDFDAQGSRRLQDLVEGWSLEAVILLLLQARSILISQRDHLHGLVMAAARRDDVCRKLMTVPGVGPVTALTFCSAVDDPQRFSRSRAVGAHFALTPRRYQSGETDRTGHISKKGDALARRALYEATNVLLTRTSRWSALKAWGLSIAKPAGMRHAKVAVARKLATMLHATWRDGTEFCWSREVLA
jgi:transposase